MSKAILSFPISDLIYCKRQLLFWSESFNISCLLDNNNYSFESHSFECIVAAGAKKILSTKAGNAFGELQQFNSDSNDWFFGHFSYDLKNELEHLKSSHPDRIAFPQLFFFIPEIVVTLSNKEISIHSEGDSGESIYNEIMRAKAPPPLGPAGKLNITGRYTKEQYLKTVRLLQKHILRGDCYEINFCQEFFSEEALIDPVKIYLSLSNISPNPFAAFYKLYDRYLLCASPERYLRKEGSTLISQPIKGTWNRNFQNSKEDNSNREQLFVSSKERSENVMIVDLVRNDLSKVCSEGTVKVTELYGIYTFPQVHQMISTIKGCLKEGVHWTEAIKATFPMGSMTGAPKKRVMELIELYEKTQRGLFSGALGYVTPGGDFDFNVVIRSILYNKGEKYLSYQVGSGITFYSDPEMEYEECMLKADAIKKVLK